MKNKSNRKKNEESRENFSKKLTKAAETGRIDVKELSPEIKEMLQDIYNSIGVSLPIQSKKVGDFETILMAIRNAYDEIIVKKNRKFKWEGPLFFTEHMKHTCVSIEQTLDYQYLKADQERHGRDFIDQVLIAAIQLGIDQGIQIERMQNDKTMVEIHHNVLELRKAFEKSNRPSEGDLMLLQYNIDRIYKELAMHYNKRK